jgi:M6 family metalloprotease-like protein
MVLPAVFMLVLSQFVGIVYAQGSSPCKIRAVSGVQWSVGFGTQTGMAPTIGNLKTGMIFVDFPGMKAVESAKSIYDTVVPGSKEYFNKASYGRLNLNVQGDFMWHTMPKSGSSYGLSQLTSSALEAYTRDAIKASGNKFSNISVLYTFTTKAASNAFGASAAMPYTVPLQDGTRVRAIVFSGVWAPPGSSNLHMVLPHETGHAMGLPDLYGQGPVSQYTGGWDAMGNWLGTSPDFFAW